MTLSCTGLRVKGRARDREKKPETELGRGAGQEPLAPDVLRRQLAAVFSFMDWAPAER